MRHYATAALFAASIGLFPGCTNDPQINAVTGGLVGAAAGSKVGSGSGRTAAMLGGAAIGTAVGGNAATN